MDVNACFKALSDSTRFEIVTMIAGEELCACEILTRFSFSQPTLSYHMKLLTESGLVNARRDGSWMRYSLNQEKFAEISNLMKQIPTLTTKTDKKETAC